MARHAGELILAVAREAIGKRGVFTLVLPGGRSPQPVFDQLVSPDYRDKFPWEETHLFWGDERCLPHEHPESNFNLARRELIEPAGIVKANIHPIPVDMDPGKSASAYRELIINFFAKRSIPLHFDCVLLGMGEDGHIASILIEEIERAREMAVFATKGTSGSPPVPRVSLGYPWLTGAGLIILLISGEKKGRTLAMAAGGTDENLPVAGIIGLPQTVSLKS